MRRLQLDLEGRLQFETVIADLSSRFINLAPPEVDDAIESAQRRVCELLGIDVSVLWEWSPDDASKLTITHVYTIPGGPEKPVGIDARATYPWALAQTLAGKTLVMITDELPPEAARDLETQHAFDIASSVVVPLKVGGGPVIGVLTFNGLHDDVEWPPEIVSRLELVAQVFANALDRRRTDQLLRETEARLTMAAESAGAGLWILDFASATFWATAHSRQIFGFEPDEEITVKTFLDCVHPDDRERLRNTLDFMRNSSDDVSVEYQIVRKDGVVRWVSSRGRHRAIPGRPDTSMGVTVDMTEARLAEDRWRLAIEATPNPMIVVDAAGRIALANHATQSVFGYSVEELLGTSVDRLLPERFRGMHRGQRERYTMHHRKMAQGRLLTGLRKDGAEIAIEVELTQLATPAGPMVLASVVDVTERHLAEIEAARTRAAVAYLSRAATLGELAGVLANEMNQPLAGIRVNAQTARQLVEQGAPDPSELMPILDDIIADDQRAADVIARLRVLLKHRESRFVPVDVNDVVQDVLRLIRFDALVPGVRVATELAAQLPPVNGDRSRLQMALLNLVMNASDAMTYSSPDDQLMVIRTSLTADGDVRMSVIDRGTGIHHAVGERLYDAFFTTRAAGLGIGLPITRIIVAAHGGVLEHENNAERGATFHITLHPVSEPVARPLDSV